MSGQAFPDRDCAEAFDYYRINEWIINAVGHVPEPSDGAVYDWAMSRVRDLQYSDSED